MMLCMDVVFIQSMVHVLTPRCLHCCSLSGPCPVAAGGDQGEDRGSGPKDGPRLPRSSDCLLPPRLPTHCILARERKEVREGGKEGGRGEGGRGARVSMCDVGWRQSLQNVLGALWKVVDVHSNLSITSSSTPVDGFLPAQHATRLAV